MAEFRPTRREINEAKAYAGRLMICLNFGAREMAAHWSAKAFALSQRIAARNQERTK